MTKNDFLDHLHNKDFTGLFTECGWNAPTSTKSFTVVTGEASFDVREVAHKGVRIYTSAVDAFPPSALRRTLDAKLRKFSHAYFIIFTLKGEEFHHQWMVPVDAVDKRRLVVAEYRDDTHAASLYDKVNGLTFGLEDTSSVIDVVAKVNALFTQNAKAVTDSFYKGFRKQHDAFVKGILGIVDDGDKNWYASVMLNRLMFCYFIQKKGFFMDKDGNPDVDYLQHHLQAVVAKKGPDKFYDTFYRGFLRGLFMDGLDSSKRSNTFVEKYGMIPYLNGGMFEIHSLEKANKDLDVPDHVFVSLFKFFDEWNWHLDDRIERDGRDINPDVLGYIFEQYINDRAQMGAYYTKEDITEYIGRNCIMPWLLNATAKKSPEVFKPDGLAWQSLRKSGDKYIFPAVKKGVDLPLPPEIEKGVAVEPQNTLRKRRAGWNAPASAEYALPSEIWRETVARRQRCSEVRSKIASGEIRDVNDFITYNLDIRAFAEDLIRDTADNLFVKHFYDSLRNVTILDPTCGSGAFLFAALNILEPLYEACLDRMEEFNAKNSRIFKDELNEIKAKYRSNRQYFIYKSIILRNLYGVDIMHEATEIARLRLFLKMVAVVEANPAEANLGLDPLPDIDFNIRCGNTLAGYATEQGIQDGLTNGDMFAYAELKDKIDLELQKASMAFEFFRREQLNLQGDYEQLVEAKKEIGKRLESIRELLDDQLYDRHSGKTKEQWLKDTQPFHWYSEFYDIMARHGGFDVIIGNPPYVEKDSLKYSVTCASCKYDNLYADCMERVRQLAQRHAFVGLIVPMSVTSIREYKNLRKFLVSENDVLLFTNHAIRPVSLFTGISQRVSIVLSLPNNGQKRLLTTNYLRTNDTSILMQTIAYCTVSLDNIRDFIIPKIGTPLMRFALQKLGKDEKTFAREQTKTGAALYYKDYGESYYIFPFCFTPWLTPVKSFKKQLFAREQLGNIFGVTNSSLFYIFYIAISDCWHFGNWHLVEFPCNVRHLNIQSELLKRLEISYKANRIQRFDKRVGGNIYEYKIGLSKPIIDEIDEQLAKHYGFTEEELDFIINYDIKYRMGDKLNEGE